MPEIEGRDGEVGPAQAREWFRALAEAFAGVPLTWTVVAAAAERDLDGGPDLPRWTDEAWAPGDAAGPRFTLRVGSGNGEGNPRDGYGYTSSAELTGPDGARVASARHGGGSPSFSPFVVTLDGLDLARWETARRVLREGLPHLRDASLGDGPVRTMVSQLASAGRMDDARRLLGRWAAAPQVEPSWPRAVADLCARAAGFGMLDRALAERWVAASAASPAAWAFLAANGGGGGRTAEEARALAWRADPWRADALRDAWARESEPAREVIRQLCVLRADPRLLWRPAGEATGDPWLAARAAEATAAGSRRLRPSRPGPPPDLAALLAARRGLPAAAKAMTPGPPPDGPAGAYAGGDVAPGWAVRTTWVWPSVAGGPAFATVLRTNAADRCLHLGLLAGPGGRWIRWSWSDGPGAAEDAPGGAGVLAWTADDPDAAALDVAAALRGWVPASR